MPPYTLFTGGYADRSVFTLSFDPTLDDPQDRLVVTDSLQHGRAPTWLTFSEDGAFSSLSVQARRRARSR